MHDDDMKTELTTRQAAEFSRRIGPVLRFLYLCRRRLDAAGYDPTCDFYRDVSQAYRAIHALSVELHYQSIRQGVGRPPKDE
jgi:hypothetical protein